MSILLNDNLNISAPFPTDNRYGQTTDGGAASLLPFTPYASATEAHGFIDISKKFIGLTVLVGTAPNITEYWYIGDPSVEANLVPKSLSIGSSNINDSSASAIQYSLVAGLSNQNYQKYSTVVGYANQVQNNTGNCNYSVALGGANIIKGNGNAAFAIGETNVVKNGFSGALGTNNVNNGNYSTAIGYTLTIPSGNKGTLQTGMFNDSTSVDYTDSIGDTSYPILSVAAGDQAALNPANYLNGFHVMKTGVVKSKDGYDARYGRRGMCLPQWSTSGWEDTSGHTFEIGAKYIIVNYGYETLTGATGSGTTILYSAASGTIYNNAIVEVVSGTGEVVAGTYIVSHTSSQIVLSAAPTTALVGATLRIGDNFSNVTDSSNIVWGKANSTGCVFYGTANSAPTLWGSGYQSTVVKVGRPTSPIDGEFGFNIETNNLEYYNGTAWRSVNSSAV